MLSPNFRVKICIIAQKSYIKLKRNFKCLKAYNLGIYDFLANYFEKKYIK